MITCVSALFFSLLLKGGLSINVPDKSVVSDDLGVVIEPESLVLSYDKVSYSVIGIHMHLLPKVEDIMLPKTECKLTSDKSDLIKLYSSETDKFFNSLPLHFTPFNNHFCHGASIDCFLDKSHTRHIDINATREKRQILLSAALIAGIASAGVGMYNILSDSAVKTQMKALDDKDSEIEEIIKNLSDDTDQFKEVSTGVYLKLYEGQLNLEKYIKKLICKASSSAEYQSLMIGLHLTLESYKNAINNALDGKVTDFLITSDLLKEKYLSKPDFEGTIYKVDPGMFFSTSTSTLIKVDPKKRIAHFLISTPIIREEDVSPLYRVSNLGWLQGGMPHEISLPKVFSYITDKNDTLIVIPELEKCRNIQGMYLCGMLSSERTSQGVCVEEILQKETIHHCEISQSQTPGCVYKTLKGGILIRGCKSVIEQHSIRSVITSTDILIPTNEVLYIPYDSFKILIINGHILSTRSSYLHTISLAPHLTGLEGVDFAELSDLPKTTINIKTLADQVDKDWRYQMKTKIYESSYVWLWIIMIFIIFILLLALWFACKKSPWSNKSTHIPLDQLIETRRLQLGNF